MASKLGYVVGAGEDNILTQVHNALNEIHGVKFVSYIFDGGVISYPEMAYENISDAVRLVGQQHGVLLKLTPVREEARCLAGAATLLYTERVGACVQ